MSADAQAAPANTPPPPRTGTWLRAQVELADGSSVEIRIPNCVGGSVSTYEPQPDEEPSLVRVEPGGRRRRGGLGQILGA